MGHRKTFKPPARCIRGSSAILLWRPAATGGSICTMTPYSTGGYGTLQAFVYGDTTAQVCLVDGGGKFGAMFR